MGIGLVIVAPADQSPCQCSRVGPRSALFTVMKIHTIAPSETSTRVFILESGEKVMESLRRLAREEVIRAGHFTAIGAFRSCRIAYFDWETKDYVDMEFDEQLEVLVLAGDIAWKDGDPVVHAHVVLGRRDGAALGGHLREAVVRPTLEVFLEEGGALTRSYDPESQLALIEGADGSPPTGDDPPGAHHVQRG